MERGLERETWRESPEDKQRRYAKEATEEQKQKAEAEKKAEEKAEYTANSIAERFQGKSHSESFYVRKVLHDIIVYKQDGSGKVDWKSTAVRRAEHLANYEHKNPSVLPSGAR